MVKERRGAVTLEVPGVPGVPKVPVMPEALAVPGAPVTPEVGVVAARAVTPAVPAAVTRAKTPEARRPGMDSVQAMSAMHPDSTSRRIRVDVGPRRAMVSAVDSREVPGSGGQPGARGHREPW